MNLAYVFAAQSVKAVLSLLLNFVTFVGHFLLSLNQFKIVKIPNYKENSSFNYMTSNESSSIQYEIGME